MARAFGRRSPESGKPELEPPPEPPPVSESIPPADAEWLDEAIDQFESRMAEVLRQAGDELYAQVERDLARTEEQLRRTEERIDQNVAERLEGAVAEVRVQGDAQVADEIARVKEAAETPLATIRKVRAEAV